jgi:outer membrane immunogenic protein
LTGEINDVMTGWTVGAGVDYAFTDNIIFRAEYRYSDFGSTTQQPFLPLFPNEQEIEFKSHDVRLGLAYKF